MKLIWGLVLTAVLLCCSAPAFADTVYNISGTATLEGTNCPSCSENFTFSLDVIDSIYPGFSFAYLAAIPGTGQITATGDLPPDTWSIGFQPGFYFNPPTDPDQSTGQRIFIADTGDGGPGQDDIEINVFTSSINAPPVVSQGIALYSCGTLEACTDFGRLGEPQADEFGYVGGGPAQITVTELLCVPTPEPSTWALLALGLSVFILLKLRRLLDGARGLAI